MLEGQVQMPPQKVTCIAGEECPLECHVDGSRPSPMVTWKTNDRILESEFKTVSNWIYFLTKNMKGAPTPMPILRWLNLTRLNFYTLLAFSLKISSPLGTKERSESSFHSTLLLTANASDDGVLIRCRASSPALTNQGVEDSIELNVLCKLLIFFVSCVPVPCRGQLHERVVRVINLFFLRVRVCKWNRSYGYNHAGQGISKKYYHIEFQPQ